MKLLPFCQLLSISSLLGASVALILLDQSVRAQAPTADSMPVQPAIGYDDVGIAQYQDQVLHLTTYTWEVTETKAERDVATSSIETRTGRRPQLNPKTGKEEMVDFTYQIPITRLSKQEIVDRSKSATQSVVKEYKRPQFAVYSLDGRQLTDSEVAKNLATPRTVLVMQTRYFGEPQPAISEMFKAMLHPGLLIVRLAAPQPSKPDAQAPRQ